MQKWKTQSPLPPLSARRGVSVCSYIPAKHREAAPRSRGRPCWGTQEGLKLEGHVNVPSGELLSKGTRQSHPCRVLLKNLWTVPCSNLIKLSLQKISILPIWTPILQKNPEPALKVTLPTCSLLWWKAGEERGVFWFASERAFFGILASFGNYSIIIST